VPVTVWAGFFALAGTVTTTLFPFTLPCTKLIPWRTCGVDVTVKNMSAGKNLRIFTRWAERVRVARFVCVRTGDPCDGLIEPKLLFQFLFVSKLT
jgi:hypothetical protein